MACPEVISSTSQRERSKRVRRACSASALLATLICHLSAARAVDAGGAFDEAGFANPERMDGGTPLNQTPPSASRQADGGAQIGRRETVEQRPDKTPGPEPTVAALPAGSPHRLWAMGQIRYGLTRGETGVLSSGFSVPRARVGVEGRVGVTTWELSGDAGSADRGLFTAVVEVPVCSVCTL